MSKKSGGISSLLNSDRAKKFKDTSFIWMNNPSQEIPSKVGTKKEQSGNKEGTIDQLNPLKPENSLNLNSSSNLCNPALDSYSEILIKTTSLVAPPDFIKAKSSDYKVIDSQVAIAEIGNLPSGSLNSASKKRDQSGNKGEAEAGTKWEQTGNKVEANWEQSRSKLGTDLGNRVSIQDLSTGSGNKVGAELGTKLGTKQEQSGSKPGAHRGTNKEQSGNTFPDTPNFFGLVGLQLDITHFLYCQCRLEGSKTTNNIAIHFIASSMNTSKDTVKVTIKRLQKKGILAKSHCKNGRGGWSQYTLSDSIYKEILHLETGNKLGANWEQYRNKLGANRKQLIKNEQDKVGTELGTSSSSSSSLINNNTITTTEDRNIESITIPEVLTQLRFGKHLIKQILERNLLCISELQDSLDAFAFDVAQNNLISDKKIQDPVRYFMGIMNKKMPYAAPSNFLTDEDKSYTENIRRFENLKRIRLEKEKLLIDLKYEQWLEELTDDEKKRIVPPYEYMPVGSTFHNQLLRSHFEKALLLGKPLNQPLDEIDLQ